MTKFNENETERDYMGMISWTRSHCSAARPMFGSEIKTDSPITIRISQAIVCRKLNKNWYHSKPDPVIEIDLTTVQWAEFLTNGNTSGVPCTITSVMGNKTSPVICENVADTFKNETEERFAEFRNGAEEIKNVIDKAISSGKPMTKTHLTELLKMVEIYKNNTEANLNYFRKRFMEDMANVVVKAKAEISAYAQLCNINSKIEIPVLGNNKQE